MQPTLEHFRSGCSIISLLTNLEVQVFDNEKVLQVHYARYDLPIVLEHLKQEEFVRILQRPLERELVYRFRDPFQMEYLAVGIWHETQYHGTIVVGPSISKAYHPQLLIETGQHERLPLIMQRQLQQYYNTLTMVDEAKQQAIGSLLINIFLPGIKQPQLIEATLPLTEGPARGFVVAVEQNRELIEKRYAIENNMLHAVATGNARLLKEAMKELQEISWPFRHPGSPVRSLKNLSLTANTLYRKAAESGGVHPLHLDSVSGKFAIQIEQAQSIAELMSLDEEMPKVYCNLVKEVSVAAFPAIIKEAITYLRFNIDQPASLNSLAGILGVNPSHLSRTFKQALGMTLTDYINQIRIEEAKYLLDHSNDTVTEIASRVGYNDSNYFSRVFRRWEHITPHDYRKRKKGTLV
ncbi:MAG TPA: AraC family transcriptional regulator [Ktedonobacteraceae bacterium]|nr:AraC family transcriptional regulator [Ktedonobacteraceae bacterium]